MVYERKRLPLCLHLNLTSTKGAWLLACATVMPSLTAQLAVLGATIHLWGRPTSLLTLTANPLLPCILMLKASADAMTVIV